MALFILQTVIRRSNSEASLSLERIIILVVKGDVSNDSEVATESQSKLTRNEPSDCLHSDNLLCHQKGKGASGSSGKGSVP